MDKYTVLERFFGYDSFRDGQDALIDGILQGRDVFGIMPTGGGKSICYQVPAMLLPGVTLVISPLISLMQDQVLALQAAGVPAAYINSTLTLPQTRIALSNLRMGHYKIVYVAPERLDYNGFLEVLSHIRISLVAVDEAHCISQWGQDFRPSYLRILNFISNLPQRPVVGAFTATATAQVREDVERILNLQNPVRVITGFDRPNLSFQVLRPEKKDPQLLKLLAGLKDKSGIVYCATRKGVEAVCELLKDRGYAATRYHAGLEEAERAANQEDFIHDRATVMVATNAFGMGIDKSNVSFVIHYNMPKSMEAYYQEAGRAGRDGTAAKCILLYSGKDVDTARFLINSNSDNEELTPEQRELIRQQDLERLKVMVNYCKTTQCLRRYILEYFGQSYPETCGNCGNCNRNYELTDITREAQMILSCVKRVRDKLGYSVGITTIIRTLQGSREKRVMELGLHKLSTYGLMKTLGSTKIRSMIEHLELEGYLVTENVHQTLVLTERAGEVLFRGKAVEMRVIKEMSPTKSGPTPLPEQASGLFEHLRRLRAELAREAGVPAYVIFSNATLEDMARKRPTNITELKRVSGVGELKANWYGQAFLKHIREYIEEE